MDNNTSDDSRLAGVVRTLIALAIFLAFLGAVAYTTWPQLVPGAFHLVQSVRAIGAEKVESRYFDVRNNSDASQTQVDFMVRTLEADYEAINAFLGAPGQSRIPVLLTNGSGPALADGVQLNVFYDRGVIDLDSAPFFLVLLGDGQPVTPDRDLFVQAGFSLYVVEEIGRAQGLIGQPTDAWVELFRRRGALLPLSQAWTIGLPSNADSAYDAARAAVEGASFMRWVARTYGLQAARNLRNGMSPEAVTGLALEEAEKQWLDAVAAQNIQPKSCLLALPSGSPALSFCKRLGE
jgi:hypothetical protein